MEQLYRDQFAHKINTTPGDSETRLSKLSIYLFSIIDTLTTDKNYQINAYMLSNDIINYSLDKIPTSSQVEKWVTGLEIHRDVFSF